VKDVTAHAYLNQAVLAATGNPKEKRPACSMLDSCVALAGPHLWRFTILHILDVLDNLFLMGITPGTRKR
jgi:hypothetical protein